MSARENARLWAEGQRGSLVLHGAGHHGDRKFLERLTDAVFPLFDQIEKLEAPVVIIIPKRAKKAKATPKPAPKAKPKARSHTRGK